MNIFVVILLPCVFGIFLYKIITKEKFDQDMMLNYLAQVFITNFIMWWILELRGHGIKDFSSYLDFSFGLQYMTGIVILSVIFSVVFAVLKRYFNFEFEVEIKNGRKKKK